MQLRKYVTTEKDTKTRWYETSYKFSPSILLFNVYFGYLRVRLGASTWSLKSKNSGQASFWLIMVFHWVWLLLSWQAAYLSFHTPFISLPALYLPPSSLPTISLRHAHQRGQVGAFKGRRCVQSDSGKGPPLPNQSTYLIHLSQGPLASLATFRTRQEGIRRVVAGMEMWREERVVEGKEKGRRLEVKKWWGS